MLGLISLAVSTVLHEFQEIIFPPALGREVLDDQHRGWICGGMEEKCALTLPLSFMICNPAFGKAVRNSRFPWFHAYKGDGPAPGTMVKCK